MTPWKLWNGCFYEYFIEEAYFDIYVLLFTSEIRYIIQTKVQKKLIFWSMKPVKKSFYSMLRKVIGVKGFNDYGVRGQILTVILLVKKMYGLERLSRKPNISICHTHLDPWLTGLLKSFLKLYVGEQVNPSVKFEIENYFSYMKINTADIKQQKVFCNYSTVLNAYYCLFAKKLFFLVMGSAHPTNSFEIVTTFLLQKMSGWTRTPGLYIKKVFMASRMKSVLFNILLKVE
jgi:hypothetical protein